MDFRFTPKETASWSTQNDTVMGGVSSSEIHHSVVEGIESITFSGEVSLDNNGGFAQMVHTFADTSDISDCSAIQIVGHGDGKIYKLRLETTAQRVSYSHSFIATKSFTLTLALDMFEKTYRGRSVPNQPDLDTRHISSIAILIGNGKEETFEISLESIESVQ